ncbi:type IV pilus modification protein PilV [Psychrobacter sp. LV10R520-6]|uniref:type IV pilus modification protein PilV n=1 Tax=Psychrobacter sp. LV10R520-6 TaxID=1415574 RepID=UPI0024C5DAC5|nr:type IV pilus modification protein PilV [Psychrobacter sp. LV10R520-6]SNT71388.1 type IV pilus assembly protein PilV [Psychrobacter sp. LV10R520-6]
MSRLSYQRGVGLVEVLVAVLLLAVAVLGFSALQINALKATNESLDRSRAMSISKQLLENMRLNSLAAGEFTEELNELNESTNNITEYCTKVDQAGGSFDKDSCKSASCTPSETAALNSWKAASLACEQDIMLNMTACPEMANINARQCIITSWGDTLPILSNADKNACGTSTGTYKRGSSCLIMEAY